MIFNILRYVLFAVSAAFVIYFIGSIIIFGLINIGSIAGLALSVWLVCITFKPLHKLISEFCKSHLATAIAYKAVNICFIAFAIYGLIVTAAMIYSAAVPPAENSTAVVLGAQVKPWGPSSILWGRINAADEYLKANPNTTAVLTGGQGEDEPVSEAESMYTSLIEKGIDSDRLYKEDKATNTTENFKYSLKIIDENNLNQDLAIVTDGFHQLRARIIAKQLGLKQNVGAVNADTSLRYIPIFAVREWFALPYQVLFR